MNILVSIESFRELALSFPDVVELPHFDKTSFRVKKKIFATLDVKNNCACLLLTPVDQSAFCAFDSAVIYPVPNKWGKSGATLIELKAVRKSMLKDAIAQAYNKIVIKKV